MSWLADMACSKSALALTRTLLGAALTLTVKLSLSPPSVSTIICASPGAIALTSPLSLTVETLVLLELHVKLTAGALLGNTAAVSCWLWPSIKLRSSPIEIEVA